MYRQKGDIGLNYRGILIRKGRHELSMNLILKITLVLVWTVLFPILTGLLPTMLLPAKKRSFFRICFSGYLLNFSVLEIMGLLILLFTPLGDFYLLQKLYGGLSALLAAAGIIFWCREKRLHGRNAVFRDSLPAAFRKRIPSPESGILWGIFGLLLLFQMYMAYTRASFDGDDAYYVTQSVLSWRTGTMYRYLPYTGITTTLDYRHAMALFPVWAAANAGLSLTHPTVFLHSFLPLVLLPLTNFAYAGAGTKLLDRMNLPDGEKGRMLPGFMILMMLFQLFGNVSIYTPETFLLTRTWQGKSIMGNLILPLGIWILLELQEEGSSRFLTAFTVLLSLASGLFTSMAPLLLCTLLLLGSFLIALSEKKVSVFFRTALGCIPCYLYLFLTVLFL